MENPTRYHVVQKQKNQVRQYLHESIKGVDDDGDANKGIIDSSYGSDGVGSCATTTTLETNNSQIPMMVQSAPLGPQTHQLKTNHQQHIATYPYAAKLLPNFLDTESFNGAMSPGLSSIATSNDDVSSIYFSFIFFISILQSNNYWKYHQPSRASYLENHGNFIDIFIWPGWQ